MLLTSNDAEKYAVTVWNQRTMTLAEAKNSLNFSHEKAKYHIGSKLFLLAKKDSHTKTLG
mgnify:FL=1